MSRNLILFIICLGKIHTNSIQDDFEPSNRIVGGQRCSVADYKYMVAILQTDGNNFVCGGSLLSARWVLTARHCINSRKEPKTYTVIAGVESPRKQFWGKDKQISVVQRYYRHPIDDIGLMNLQESIKLSSMVGYVMPATYTILMGRKLEKVCSNSTLIGWGSQNVRDINPFLISNNITKPFDPYLQCVTLAVISPQECYKRLNLLGKTNVTESNFCAYKENADACMGDSGGPLLCNGVQYGIVSYGYGCASKDYPGMYVKVHYFESFIQSTMKEANAELSQNRSCLTVKTSFLVAIIHQDILISYEYVCAGSILTQIWVLTSGHCTKKCKTPSYYTVVAGLTDFFNFDPNDKRVTTSQVVKCFQSPTYNKPQDIALMKLKNGFHPSKKVSFIRLATLLDIEKKNFKRACSNGTLIGYRRTKYSMFHTLQCDQTTVSTNKRCYTVWPSTKLGSRHGCVDRQKSDECYTILGAPLICGEVQYGVLSSVACTERLSPSPESLLVARVYKYSSFLQKMVYVIDINDTNSLRNANGDMNNSVNLYIFTLYFVIFLI